MSNQSDPLSALQIGRWEVHVSHLRYHCGENGQLHKAGSEVMYMATNPFGDDRAFHPLLKEKEVAQRVVDILNALRWDEGDYLDNADAVVRAARLNKVRRFIRIKEKHSGRRILL